MRPAGPLGTAKAAQPILIDYHWSLNLIRQTGDLRVALLNGQLVSVGGRVDGALVTRIDTDQVTLRLPDNRSINLQLPSAQLRQARN